MFGQYSDSRTSRSNPLTSTRTTSKRQVFPTSEIPHLWMHQTQDSARNSYGNLYFAGATIYSYGSHFPIASHVVNAKGARAILLTSDKYSVTTGAHVSDVRHAIPSSARIFRVPLSSSMTPNDSGELSEYETRKIVESYVDAIRARVASAKAARMGKKIQEWLDAATSKRAELLAFVEFFGLPQMSERARIAARKLPIIPASVEAAKVAGKAAKVEAARVAKVEAAQREAQYAALIADWMAAHPEYAARWDGTKDNAESLAREYNEAEAARKRAEQDARSLATLTVWMSGHPEVCSEWDGTYLQGADLRKDWEYANYEKLAAQRLADWIAGANVSTSSLSYGADTELRIKGDTVETTRGANFPVSHAVRGLALVRAVMAKGETWHANGHTCKLGHYQIDRVTGDGTVYAGCHVVPFHAIARIAPQLDAYRAGCACVLGMGCGGAGNGHGAKCQSESSTLTGYRADGAPAWVCEHCARNQPAPAPVEA